MITNGLKPPYYRNICQLFATYISSEGLRTIWTVKSLNTSDTPAQFSLYLTKVLSMTVTTVMFSIKSEVYYLILILYL